MSNPMDSHDIIEAILASLDTLAEDKKAADQALSKITAIVEQSHEITRQSHEVMRQSHETTRQSHETTRQSHEVMRQSHETTRQAREFAELAAERLKANDKLHETLIRLVKALDTGC